MGQDLLHNPWFWGILVFLAAFALNTIRRLASQSGRTSTEKKLEWNMLRAASAVRKLGRARRILQRFIAVRAAAPQVPMPGMVRRLWKASSDAGDADGELSAVLKKLPELGCSVAVLRNVDNYIWLAKRTREECRQAVRGKSTANARRPPAWEDLARCAQGCSKALDATRSIVDAWAEESQRAEQSLAGTVEPTVWRSSGIFRNPLKPEDSVEIAQTESVINLRWTMEDIRRTQQCLEAVQRAVDALRVSEGSRDGLLSGIVSDALDAIDVALGDAELPLPEGLVQGETPLQPPAAEPPAGLLQTIYAGLVTVEAALFAAAG